MNDAPLAGLTIAVTRPVRQAQALASRIAALGGQPVIFPLLEIVPPHDPARLQEKLARLGEFQLAIFISPTAVQQGLAALGGPLPAGLRIAAVGQGSARALAEAGVGDVIAPQHQFDSEALLALPELQQLAGSRVLIFRGEGGREVLADGLRARGATVEYAECYRRAQPSHDAAWLLAQAPDVLTLTSSEALGHLWEMLDAAGRAHVVALPLFAPHPRIAERARQLGWREAHGCAGGDDGLLAGLVAWANNRVQP